MPSPTTYGLSITSSITAYSTILGSALFTPRGEWFDGRGVRDLANGQQRLIGLPYCIHIWDFLPPAKRTALRAILTAASGTCYIWTRKNDSDAFAAYTATYRWPYGNENKDFLYRMDFRLEFRNLVVVP